MWAKFDCAGANAFAFWNPFPAAPTALWVQFDIVIPTTTLTACADHDLNGTTATVVRFGDVVSSVVDAVDTSYPSGAWEWRADGLITTSIPLVGGTTYTLKAHAIDTNTIDWYVDGVLLRSQTARPNYLNTLYIGGNFSEQCTCEWYFITNVMVGTTDGGSDMFFDDFSSGDFSNWTSHVGACSVVAAPTTCGTITLDASPDTGCQGDTISLTGAGFDATSPITVTFDGIAVVFSEADSDGSGNISGTFDVPWGVTACTTCTYNIVATTAGGANQTVTFTMCCPEASDVPDDSLTVQLGSYVDAVQPSAPWDYIRFAGAHWFVVSDGSVLDATNRSTLPPPTNHTLNVVRIDDVGTVTVYPVDTNYAWGFDSSLGSFLAGNSWTVNLFFDGWDKPIYDAKLATDGVTLWLAVVTRETVLYPYITSDDNHDGHPSQASQFVPLGTLTSGFTSFPTGPGTISRYIIRAEAALNTYNDDPPYSDSGDSWFGYWNPPRVVVFSSSGAGFTRVDTEDALYCPGNVAATNNAITAIVSHPVRYNAGQNSALFSGISAWASPSQVGVCHVIWSEGGEYGRYGAKNVGDPLGENLDVWDGNAADIGYRVNYSQWSSAAKTASTDIFSTAINRRAWYFTYDNGSGLGAAPYGYTWPVPADLAWTNVFQVRNDNGSPALFLAAQNTVVDPSSPNGNPDPHGNPFLDNVPSWADPAVKAYDLSSGSAVLAQTLSGALLPTVGEVGAPAPNQLDAIWVSGFNPINGSGGLGVSQIYVDPLLSNTPVYLIGVLWINVVTQVPTNGCVGFYRIPCDLSATFDILDGRRFVNYSILGSSGFDPTQYADFFSDTNNVWYPTQGMAFGLEQLDRKCAGAWVSDITFFPDHTVNIPTRAGSGLYYNSSTGALYYAGLFGSGVYAIAQVHICRGCLSCSCGGGLHIWQRI